MMHVRIDRAGRVVLPKSVREKLELSAGDVLTLVQQGDDVTLTPLRDRPTIRKKDGIWMVSAGQPLSAETVEDTLERVRASREHQAAGSAEE